MAERTRRSNQVTVLIATRNRPASLERCLRSVFATDHPGLRVVVVDNAPDDDTTFDLVSRMGERLPVTYVREPRRGLGRAHNSGLHHVRTPIVAITDDDVVVDPGWIDAILDAFSQSADIGCVTGRIVAAELATPAQRWVETHLGFSKGTQSRRFDLQGHRPDDPLFPFAAGALGSGANMAFRTDVLRVIGGFDPALGAGTPARGGDDLAAFHAVISRGFALVYEPGAVVRHHHHADIGALERQIHGYGVGLGAYLTKLVAEDPRVLADMARRAAPAFRRLRSMRAANEPQTSSAPRRRTAHVSEVERRLSRLPAIERRAVLAGPIAYGRSRLESRQGELSTHGRRT